MALLPSPSSSSSSSITYGFTFDVFLSFRGADTRHNFTGNLYKALCDKGIHTFIDDEELHKGDEITPALEEAIEKSRIFIVVLSKNYASSSFCLHELSKILDCFKEDRRLVWPVFYDVDPSDVRKQTGTYREAMALHMERFKDNKEMLQKWRMALQQVANFSGWHFKHGITYENKFIGEIVNEVSRKINRVALPIADFPVGLELQVRKVIWLLDVESHDIVRMVGIHGAGGIGKTTLSLAVYNSIADQFEGLCFLQNVRENSNKHGLLHLQKTLLLDVLGEKKIKLTSEKQGISIIQHRLCQKKVLLILDDVDKEEQLAHLAGSPSWFGHGSRVIITTRDKQLLAHHEVKRTYEVQELMKKDAFELLRWKAFKNDKVSPSYVDILNRVVTYASGLPLALEVIGSNLYGKSIPEWESALEQYERIPDKKIQKILEVSFDALEEEEKSVFLDIACCFKGYEFEQVKNILNAHHDQCITYQIGVLVDKSLIKVAYDSCVILHDLIEDMGKEIVRQESPKEPGNRSRLWSQKDIFEVLEENTGTSKIEMIHFDYLSFEEVDWNEESFKKMTKLKTLIIRQSHFSICPKYLPNSLRVLEWWKYPSHYLPCDFHPKKLFICKLPRSSLMSLELLSSSKKFVTMKVLNLNDCQHLTQLPDISSLPNLEELSFTYCKNLITIDHPVLSSVKLKSLNASNCDQLRRVPPLNLPSLVQLSFGNCSSLESFPEILEKMEDVSSTGSLARLQSLGVSRWPPSRILVMLSQLTELYILGTRTLEIEDEICEDKLSSMLLVPPKVESLCLGNPSHGSLALLPSFPNLKELVLSGDTFTIVPECIKQCRFLSRFQLYKCNQLREIKGVPPTLKCLFAEECPSLSFSSRSMLLKKELHEAGDTNFYLPSPETGRVPEWFEQQSMGPSPLVSFWFRNRFPHSIIFCLVSPLLNPAVIDGKPQVDIILNGKKIHSIRVPWGHTRLISGEALIEWSSFKVVEDALLENEWNHVLVMNMISSKEQISSYFGIGIHVIKEKSSMEDIRFTDPYEKSKFDSHLPLLPKNDANSDSKPSTSNSENNVKYLVSDSELSSTDSDEGDESSNYETPPCDFSSESSLSNTDDSDVEGKQGDEFSIDFNSEHFDEGG